MSKELVTLPIDEVRVQERQVSIRVLTIGTKQITQALYKQLPEEEVIDDGSGLLLGKVWGWVNLHSDCKKYDHLHAIWEQNGQLKRSCTPYSYRNSDTYQNLRENLEELATVYVCLVALAGRVFNHWSSGQERLPLTIKGQNVSIKLPYDVKELFDAPQSIKKWQEYMKDSQERGESTEYYQRVIDNLKELRQKGILEILGNNASSRFYHVNPEDYTSYEQAYEATEKMAAETNIFEGNWRKSYKAIEQAGQLFIAVSGVWK